MLGLQTGSGFVITNVGVGPTSISVSKVLSQSDVPNIVTSHVYLNFPATVVFNIKLSLVETIVPEGSFHT